MLVEHLKHVILTLNISSVSCLFTGSVHIPSDSVVVDVSLLSTVFNMNVLSMKVSASGSVASEKR